MPYSSAAVLHDEVESHSYMVGPLAHDTSIHIAYIRKQYTFSFLGSNVFHLYSHHHGLSC